MLRLWKLLSAVAEASARLVRREAAGARPAIGRAGHLDGFRRGGDGSAARGVGVEGSVVRGGSGREGGGVVYRCVGGDGGSGRGGGRCDGGGGGGAGGRGGGSRAGGFRGGRGAGGGRAVIERLLKQIGKIFQTFLRKASRVLSARREEFVELLSYYISVLRSAPSAVTSALHTAARFLGRKIDSTMEFLAGLIALLALSQKYDELKKKLQELLKNIKVLFPNLRRDGVWKFICDLFGFTRPQDPGAAPPLHLAPAVAAFASVVFYSTCVCPHLARDRLIISSAVAACLAASVASFSVPDSTLGFSVGCLTMTQGAGLVLVANHRSRNNSQRRQPPQPQPQPQPRPPSNILFGISAVSGTVILCFLLARVLFK